MAPLSGTHEMSVELACSAEKLWDIIKNSTEHMPKIFPNEYKSIEIIEGDGKSPGSVRKIQFSEEVPHMTFLVEKYVSCDEASMTVKSSTVDGEIMKCFKVFNPTISVSSKGDGGCTLKWSVEYEKLNEDGPPPEVIAQDAKKHFEALGAYLHQN